MLKMEPEKVVRKSY